MPRGMFKSGRFRKVFVKTPGGKTTIHYRERAKSKAHCAECHTVLAGTPTKTGKFAASARRPERPYGGKLCSVCTRRLLRAQARREVQ